MSEYPEYNSGMSHALWHTFQPSTALETYTGQLLSSGDETSFRFRSTKEALIDSIAYQHRVHKEAMNRIEAQNRQAVVPFAIAKVATRLLRVRTLAADGEIHRHEVLRVAAMPAHPGRFQALVSMLDELPSAKEGQSQQPAKHYLVVDFHENLFKPGGITEGDLNVFREGTAEYIAKGLFNAALIGLSGAERADLHENTTPDWLMPASSIA